MQINCPHCAQPIEIVADEQPVEVTCPSCDSRIPLMEDPAAAPTILYRTSRIAHFELLEQVGRGAFGSVWRARDTKLDRIVAVKVPRAEQLAGDRRDLMLREAQAAAQLAHPNIVSVYDVGREFDLVYIVSEFIDGITLAEKLKLQPLSRVESVRLIAKLADAVHYAHEQSVVHRDLKPSNVLIDPQGEPHLTDFGVAKRISAEMTVTADGHIIGTPAYMSPEQARGENVRADRRMDVYSLGVILYQLITHHLPFTGGSSLMLHQIAHLDPKPPRKIDPGIPRDLETICLKAMEKSPERRYQTAAELAADLRRLLAGEPILARPASRTEKLQKFLRRKPHVAITAASLALAAVITMGATWYVIRDTTFRWQTVIETDPPGAWTRVIPLDEFGQEHWDRAIVADDTTPLTIPLEPGDYRIQVDVAGHGFHDVFRRVPESAQELPDRAFPHLNWTIEPGRLRLPQIRILPEAVSRAGMTLITGDQFTMGHPTLALDGAPPHPRLVESFLIEPSEVTAAEYRRVVGHLPTNRDAEPHQPADEEPLGYVTWHRAVRFAELSGKRLPSEVEYEFVATRRGTADTPWGGPAAEISQWHEAGNPGDRTDDAPPLAGLYSGPLEWTSSSALGYQDLVPEAFGGGQAGRPRRLNQALSTARIVRGGPASALSGAAALEEVRRGPRQRFSLPRTEAPYRQMGFRCARNVSIER